MNEKFLFVTLQNPSQILCEGYWGNFQIFGFLRYYSNSKITIHHTPPFILLFYFQFTLNPNMTNIDSLNQSQFPHQTNLVDSLLLWSGKRNYSILFDSDVHGSGKITLPQTVLHKRNLYFITTYNNNVYGGHITSTIKEFGVWIKDPNCFVFSLMRNGKINPKCYEIEGFSEDDAFIIDQLECNGLYTFGGGYSHYFAGDVDVYPVGTSMSSSDNNFFNYLNDDSLLDISKDESFSVERIVVLEMN